MVMGLTTGLWVSAQVRLCDRAFIPAAVVRRGDPDAGTVLLKLNRFEAGVTVYTQASTMSDEPAWSRGTGPNPVPEAEAGADEAVRWSHVEAGDWLRETLDRLRHPESIAECQPGRDLAATLRPYQVDGVRCERCVLRLGKVLEGHDGLESANATLMGDVILVFDDERTTRQALLNDMVRGGFRERLPV